MAADQENPWLGALARHSGIRRALIVSGSVNDVCYSADTQDYRQVVDVLMQALQRKGFDEVVLWDRFSGVQNVSAQVRQSLEREAVMGDGPEPEQAGEEYDAADEEPAPNPEQTGNPGPQNPEDFFSVVYHHLLHPTGRCRAFVVDYSHYLFGSANSLSEEERQWLLILSKAIRNAPMPLDAEHIAKPGNIVVFVCSKLGGLPPSLYQDNPMVQEVVVPMPGRVEREAFLKRTLDLWLLRKPLRPGEAEFNDFVDSLEGFHLRDLQQLIKLSRQIEGDPLTPEKLINLYKYGERTSPWEDLSRQKLEGTEEALRQRVKGQDEAIAKVRDVIIRAYTGLSGLQHSSKQKKPKGVLFFVGPTGVGKTELAKALAQFLFGDEEACLRFDMSEFNHEHSDQRLVGAPPGYVGYEEGGQLTNAVKTRPFSVLLFDEIEKAHGRILDKFLQILEDGRLTDGKGETVYFAETIIIFTSNIGAAKIAVSDDHESVKRMFIEEVRQHFVRNLGRPEILSRIGDNIVPFNFVTNDAFLIDIAGGKLAPLKERLREKYRIEDLVFEDEQRSLGALIGSVDRSQGGRGVPNQIATRLIDPLADFLFQEEEDPSYYAGRKIRVQQAGNSPKFAFTLE